MALCVHLEDYTAQYRLTEAAYQQCVRLVDAVLAEGPGSGRARLVTEAVEEWRKQDESLRALLLDLVKAGRVRLPRRMATPGVHRHAPGTQGTIICTTCRRTVPKLKYAEWQFAYNGTITFRGEALPVPQAAHN